RCRMSQSCYEVPDQVEWTRLSHHRWQPLKASPPRDSVRAFASVGSTLMTTIFLRYLDVCLVLATAPFVLAAGLPMTGYLIGATAWLITRVAVAALQARSLRSRDPRVRAGLQVGT